MVNDETERRFAARMREAREGGQPWFVLGTLLKESLDAAADDAAVARIRLSGAEAAQLSSGVLRRFVSLLDRLQAIALIEGLDVEALTSPVFNAAEVAVRIYDRNPEVGLQAIRDLKAGQTTLVKLRELLSTVPAKVAARNARQAEEGGRPAKTAGELFTERLYARHASMEDAIGRTPMVPPGAMTSKRRSTSFVRTGSGSLEIVTSVSNLERKVHAAAELLVYENDEVSSFERHFPAFALLATLYPAFYLVFSPVTPPQYLEAALRLVDQFDIRSIGIWRTTDGGEVERLLDPSGPPEPNRMDRYGLFFPPRRRVRRVVQTETERVVFDVPPAPEGGDQNK